MTEIHSPFSGFSWPYYDVWDIHIFTLLIGTPIFWVDPKCPTWHNIRCKKDCSPLLQIWPSCQSRSMVELSPHVISCNIICSDRSRSRRYISMVKFSIDLKIHENWKYVLVISANNIKITKRYLQTSMSYLPLLFTNFLPQTEDKSPSPELEQISSNIFNVQFPGISKAAQYMTVMCCISNSSHVQIANTWEDVASVKKSSVWFMLNKKLSAVVPLLIWYALLSEEVRNQRESITLETGFVCYL